MGRMGKAVEFGGSHNRATRPVLRMTWPHATMAIVPRVSAIFQPFNGDEPTRCRGISNTSPVRLWSLMRSEARARFSSEPTIYRRYSGPSPSAGRLVATGWRSSRWKGATPSSTARPAS